MSESLSTERTFFNAGTRIEGTLELDGEVKLEGQIKGKVSGTGVVVIGEQANLEANVFAPTIVVHGVVRGEVHASEHLELHRTARVKGTIRAPRIRIDEGATFEGECRMAPKEGGGKAEPKKEEKRSSPLTLTATQPGSPAKTAAQS
jgi:cytoskeletal protein CcmA (bactofilin family)